MLEVILAPFINGMNVSVGVGDVLDASADVLISTANPWLNMSGGVNGAIRQRFARLVTVLSCD